MRTRLLLAVLIPTCVAGAQHLLEAGNVDGALPVVNFGGGPEREFAELEKYRSLAQRRSE